MYNRKLLKVTTNYKYLLLMCASICYSKDNWATTWWKCWRWPQSVHTCYSYVKAWITQLDKTLKVTRDCKYMLMCATICYCKGYPTTWNCWRGLQIVILLFHELNICYCKTWICWRWLKNTRSSCVEAFVNVSLPNYYMNLLKVTICWRKAKGSHKPW